MSGNARPAPHQAPAGPPADGDPELVFELPEITVNDVVNLYAVSNTDGDIYLAAQLPDGTVATINADAAE